MAISNRQAVVSNCVLLFAAKDESKNEAEGFLGMPLGAQENWRRVFREANLMSDTRYFAF